jgi:predicted ATPase/class 3 adenylate cyclase
VQDSAATFLFTDIEGSSRLWEQEPARMRVALARHDALVRGAVERHGGTVVKMTGDGVHAVFGDPAEAVRAALDLQQSLARPERAGDLYLPVRCGLHLGVEERRDNDYFGPSVNRAARIMGAAHGGQVLVSQAVAEHARDRLDEGVTLVDLGVVNLRDLAKPEHIYQLAHPRLRREFPALRSLAATPNNLPQQLTSFVGREAELAKIKALLASTRLLTLLGPGGIGKTRLSLRVAAEVIGDYPDGAWLAELAGLTDADLVVQAVATALGVKEVPGRTLHEELARVVATGKRLLVLDNCEHLIAACARLARELTRAAPGLTILASSREGLRVEGETTFPLSPLAVPVTAGAASPETLAQYDAVRLFVDRAAAAQPAFVLTVDNAAAVLAICRDLDGIPLALELAAARVRALPVAQIAARLSDRFRLLTSGSRDALPRQQTLRALIDWSYDLLATPEQKLLCRLAVFAGGFALDAGEAVGADGEIDAADVLELLGRLVEKSLVTMDEDTGRYRLLETIRQYALERLAGFGEAAAAHERHLAHYLALADEAQPALVGAQQGVWLTRLDGELENLLAAHAWCDQAADGAARGIRLAHDLKRYWFNRGLLGLGRKLALDALTRPGAQRRDALRCEGLFDAGQLAFFAGDYPQAQTLLEECLAIARERGDDAIVARVLQPLGTAYLGQGRAQEARRHLEDAVALARAGGDKRQIAGSLNALAQLHRTQAEFDRAEHLYQDVVVLARELDDRNNVAIGLLNLAMTAIARGAPGRARPMLAETVDIALELGVKPIGQSALEVCAGLAASCGERLAAAAFFGAAEAHAALTGLSRDPADEAFLAPRIAAARVATDASAFAAAEAGGRALGYDAAIVRARAWLGALSASEARPVN